MGITSDGKVVEGTSLQQGADHSMVGGGSSVRAAQPAAASKKRARKGEMQNGNIESFFGKEVRRTVVWGNEVE